MLDGKWGNGIERRIKLIEAGYDDRIVQNEINHLWLYSPKKRSHY